MGIWYTTREDVMSAQDIKATAYSSRDIDRAIESASRRCEGLLHRVFYPWTGTRSFDYPTFPAARSWRLWFGQYDLASLTSIANNDGSSIATGNVFLNPQEGPPYEWLEINRGSVSSFASGLTSQRAVGITGVWGWALDEELSGLAAEVMDATETGMDMGTLNNVGVGSVLRIDSERMVVTDKQWLTTGETVTLTAQNNAQSITVADGTKYSPGESLLVDSERLLVLDVAGNLLTVKRASDGSTLAAHTTATIYARRTLTVTRGALGTTAATHLTAAPVYRWTPHGLLAELAEAYAIDALLQRESGYARTVGEGDNQIAAPGGAIARLEKAARSTIGRQARKSVV